MTQSLTEEPNTIALEYARNLGGLFTSIAAAETEHGQGELLAQDIPSVVSCDLSGYLWCDDADKLWHLRTQYDAKQSAINLDQQLANEVQALSDELGHGPAPTNLIDNSEHQICPLLREFLQVPTLAMVPVVSLDGVLGFVLAGRNVDVGFAVSDISMLLLLGEHVAIMTNNRRRQAALVAQERHFHAAFTNTPVMMYAIDTEARFVSVSEQWLKVMGYTREEALGRKASEFLADESRRRVLSKNIPQVLGLGIPQTVEITLIKKNGETVDVILTSVADRNSEGDIIGANAALVDITERNAAESRVRELETEMHHISRLSAMGEMATGLAHELNQPLTAMINFVQASRRQLQSADGAASDRVYEYMDDAVAQAARAGEIIRRLREFVQRGEIERLLEDIVDVVEEASAMALVGAADKGISVDYGLDADLPPVLIDRIQIQQVVFNLVRNASRLLKMPTSAA